MKKTNTFLSLAVLIALMGCQSASAPIPVAPTPTPTSPVQTQGSATLTGRVVLNGTPPTPTPINRDADARCLDSRVTSVTTESIVAAQDGGLANVVVWIENLPAEAATNLTPVTLTQKGCRYDPHVVALRVGQTLQIINADTTSHNVHSQSTINPSFNESQPQFRKVIEKSFAAAEDPFQLKCDVHPWMSSYVFVAANPYFAVTQTDGTFRIANLPAGTYHLVAWQEKFGKITKDITVTDGATVNETITFGQSAPQ
jgi:plastocyanin